MFQIGNIGYHHVHDNTFHMTKKDGLNHWLFLAIRTTAIFKINGQVVNSAPNSIIIFSPNQPYEYYADDVFYSDDWCHFNVDEQDIQFMQQYGIPFNKIISFSSLDGISTIIRYICCEFFSDNPCRNISSDLYFRLIILKIHESISSEHTITQIKDIPYFSSFIKIRDDIMRTPSQQWDVEQLAASIGFSVSHFQHLYVKAFGVSLRQDIIKSRIILAQRLLRTTEKTILEISEACGYDSVNYFIKVFKSKTGKTPSAYRAPYKDPPGWPFEQ